MSTFKALRIHRVEGGTRSRFDTVSLHDLTPGEVVIRVAYSCLNYKDALAVSGKAPITRGAVRTAGIDLSGIVESSSDGSFAPGDRVLVTGSNIGESLDGGFAQFARVPAQAVVALPEQLGLFEAMVLGTADLPPPWRCGGCRRTIRSSIMVRSPSRARREEWAASLSPS